MNTPMTVPSPRRVHGASLVTILVALAILVGIAAAAWFLILYPHRQAMQAGQPVAQAGQQPAKKAAPPVDVAAMSTSELLAEASKAIKDQRLLAPKGNNAFEFYLKVLDRQPNNQVAKDALRETFPFAANAAEQAINQGEFAEAQREIGLLARADPDNYTLTILRSKLDARRKVRVAREQAAQLAKQKQEQEAAAAAKAKQAQIAKQHAQQLAAQRAAQQAAVKAARREKAAQLAEQKPQPAKPPRPKVVIQGAVLVKQVKPRYPPSAARMRRQGWVEVQFTVGTDGKVHDVHVVAADPNHVFNHAAVRAVSRWEFKPALRNGEPMAVTMKRKIEFKLSAGS